MDEFEFVGLIDQSNVSPIGEREGDQWVFDCFVATREFWTRLPGSGRENVLVALPTDNDEADDEAFPVVRITVSARDLPCGHLAHAGAPHDTTWYRLVVTAHGDEGVPVLMDGDEGQLVWRLLSLVPLDIAQASRLDALVDAPLCGEATDYAIGHALEGLRTPWLDACVHDVGQGSLVAVFREDDCPCQPVAYVDLGWPTNAWLKTAPPHVPTLAEGIPVVLTHWDTDHWRLAAEKMGWSSSKGWWKITWRTAALDRIWIVPGCGPAWNHVKLVPSQWRLALALARRTNLLRWPAALTHEVFDGAAIYRISGGVADNNNNGLAVVVAEHDPSGLAGPAILLPGDADYGWVAGIQNQRGYQWRGLAASHHGADVTFAAIPTAEDTAWLAISVGHGAPHGHPTVKAQSAYIEAGWQYQALTSHRRTHVVGGIGAVLLTTRDQRALPGCTWLGFPCPDAATQ